jgi:hypothetical protein
MNRKAERAVMIEKLNLLERTKRNKKSPHSSFIISKV